MKAQMTTRIVTNLTVVIIKLNLVKQKKLQIEETLSSSKEGFSVLFIERPQSPLTVLQSLVKRGHIKELQQSLLVITTDIIF